MKRARYDVKRWYVYLYRTAQSLPLADDCDSSDRRFEDELFARLYDQESIRELPDLL